MRVCMNTIMAGSDARGKSRSAMPGDVIVVSEEEGKTLIDQRFAKAVATKPEPKAVAEDDAAEPKAVPEDAKPGPKQVSRKAHARGGTGTNR